MENSKLVKMQIFIDPFKLMLLIIYDPSPGIMIAQATTRKSHRCSAAKAFLLPLRNIRNNLHISKDSLVLKINIDPKTKQTTGVTFDKKGQIYYVRATKEVIVSAGTKASPQLLMLSGIGPAAHLNEMSINVLSDLPVGQNLQVTDSNKHF